MMLKLSPETAEELDRMSGVTQSTGMKKATGNMRDPSSNLPRIHGNVDTQGWDDSGGASRFFYVAKVSPLERNAGCDGLPEKQQTPYGEFAGTEDHGANRQNPVRNHHSTLKPIALIRYLATLVLPPPHVEAKLLIPFAGAGSEMCGSLIAGWPHVTGIEREPDYVRIADARLKFWRDTVRGTDTKKPKGKRK